MLNTHVLALASEQLIPLDQQEMASISGGDGIKEWLAKQIGTLLFDCISGSLDAVISAAEEGYEDAR